MPFIVQVPSKPKKNNNEKDFIRRSTYRLCLNTRNVGYYYFNGNLKSKLMPNYRMICCMYDHYSDLVKTARHAEELEVRLQGLSVWKAELLKYQN